MKFYKVPPNIQRYPSTKFQSILIIQAFWVAHTPSPYYICGEYPRSGLVGYELSVGDVEIVFVRRSAAAMCRRAVVRPSRFWVAAAMCLRPGGSAVVRTAGVPPDRHSPRSLMGDKAFLWD